MYVANYGIPNAKLPSTGRRLLAAAERPDDDADNSPPTAHRPRRSCSTRSPAPDGTRASATRELRATRVEDGILGDIRFDDKGDLVEGPVTIYRFTRKGPKVDRVVTVRATGGG